MSNSKFAVFAPGMVGGIKLDIPVIFLPESYQPASSNVRLLDGAVVSGPRLSHYFYSVNPDYIAENEGEPDNDIKIPAVTPDGLDLLKLHWYRRGDNITDVGYLLGFTAKHVYRWDAVSSQWSLIYTSSMAEGVDHWSVCSFGDLTVFCNGHDKIQQYNGVDPVENVGGVNGVPIKSVDSTARYIETARLCYNYQNYLIFADTTINGEQYPHDIRWCACGDIEAFDSEGSGGWTVSGSGNIVGLGVFNQRLIVFKEESIYGLWLTNTDLIFNGAPINDRLGSLSPDCIFNGPGGELLFMASDRSVRVIAGTVGGLTTVSDNVAASFRHLTDKQLAGVFGCYSTRMDLAIISYPAGDSEVNNKTLFFADGGWFPQDIGIGCVGYYREDLAYALRIADLPGKIADLSGSIAGENAGLKLSDEVFGRGGDLVRFTADTDNEILSSFDISTDITDNPSLHVRKRLHVLRLYFSGGTTGTMDIAIEADSSGLWQALPAVLLGSNRPIWSVSVPVDITGSTFRLRFSSYNDFAFLGVIFDYSEVAFEF